MQLTLATNFEPDMHNMAVVTVNSLLNTKQVAEVRIDFAYEGTARHKVVIADYTPNCDLDAVTQMKIGLAAAELIDSYFTGNDAPSRIEV